MERFQMVCTKEYPMSHLCFFKYAQAFPLHGLRSSCSSWVHLQNELAVKAQRKALGGQGKCEMQISFEKSMIQNWWVVRGFQDAAY